MRTCIDGSNRMGNHHGRQRRRLNQFKAGRQGKGNELFYGLTLIWVLMVGSSSPCLRRSRRVRNDRNLLNGGLSLRVRRLVENIRQVGTQIIGKVIDYESGQDFRTRC
jgi:hypothetical protein